MTAPEPLRWRCRRGMRELDVLLERWLARHWETATAAEQAAFARLLSYPDPLLWDWLVAGHPGPDEELAALCCRIRASV
ncbi:antitoxin CptB [Methylomarinovum tepidoasis]|uniref:FAD assembly factor SdhE n=1 Tax=Methylomarinovum tepidoasis TaxID=2840183 RepID=A0AAU9C8C7_9GAMM|nr:succinate dehydrogenase assembly factor 2 [Methylomarinovum sp. IN45]BCX89937.1 antitoxin CptB [Methylomarinovum sp. IN45]